MKLTNYLEIRFLFEKSFLKIIASKRYSLLYVNDMFLKKSVRNSIGGFLSKP